MEELVLIIALMISVALHFWYISLAIYAGMIWLQFALARRIQHRNGHPVLIRTMATLQMAFLLLPLVLYPFMPGSTSTGEPLGLNEKALYAALITAGVISLCVIVSTIACIVGLRHDQEEGTPNQAL